jgi:alpha-N-arabinofuranosidase
MHCYAPLFVNVNPGGMQWTSDLIGYDTMTAYASPAYWAQQMFANHHGDKVLNIAASGLPYREWIQQPPRRTGGPGAPGQQQAAPAANAFVPQTPMPRVMPDMFFSATRDSEKIYVKIVNRSATQQQVNISLTGVKTVAPAGKAITLSAANVNDTNTITEPNKIVPVTTDVTGVAPEFSRTVPANSITVLELNAK